MLIDFKLGVTGVVLRVKVRAADGNGLTGLTHASSGLTVAAVASNEAATTAYTVAAGNVETVTTLGTYEAPTSGKCRFRELDATYHKGVYEIHLADARYAVSSARSLLVSLWGASGMLDCDALVPLRGYDPQDATSLGLTNLGYLTAAPPDAAANAAAVWSEPKFSYTTSGTFGDHLNRISVSALGEATWEYLTANAVDAGSFGVLVKTALAYLTATPPTVPQITAGLWGASRSDYAAAGTFGETLQTRTGTAQAGTSTTITLASGNTIDPSGRVLYLVSGTGAGQSGVCASFVSGTKVATMRTGSNWVVIPDNTTEYLIGQRIDGGIAASVTGAVGSVTGAVTVSDKTGYKLASDGLDSVVVETGCNARQAISVIAAATAGVVSGNDGATVTIKGAGVATTRIVATVDGDANRTAVTLTLPS